jgi:MFS family permease
MPALPPLPAASPSLRQLLRQRDYVLFWNARFFGGLAASAQAVIIAWEIYELARRNSSVAEAALAVGLVGLAQFLPLFALTLTAGETADRHNRRVILLSCVALELLTVGALAWRSVGAVDQLWPIYAAGALFGCARAFYSPAASATGPMLVPIELLPQAVAANSLAWQTSAILGPALGGLLCAISPTAGYVVCIGLYLLSALAIVLIRTDTQPAFVPGRSRVALIKEGLDYIWGNKIVLGAISLDLFAVLLGGATALLPVFARDVLHVGPQGFGILRAAPAVGAMVVAAWLAVRPIRTHAGVRMFWAVGAFGLLTVVFALSRSFLFSLVVLALLGAADMVSVFIRQSLVQIVTPDPMRGRVSAVSTLFVGASNELGEFETGLLARVMGPVAAAVFGGVASMGVTALWAKLFPSLRKADRLV